MLPGNRHVRGLLVALALVLAGAVGGGAPAQTPQGCFVLRLHPGGILEQCGDRLRSLMLEFNDISRQPIIDASGAFGFVCPVEEMCVDAPAVTGWLIDPRRWTRSNRDEEAIFSIFRQPPRAGGFAPGGLLTPAQPTSACKVFDIEIAGLAGRGACYQSDDPKTSAVVVAAANDEIGYLFAFYQREVDWQTLREHVIRLAPRFRVAVETGDIGLLKWIR